MADEILGTVVLPFLPVCTRRTSGDGDAEDDGDAGDADAGDAGDAGNAGDAGDGGAVRPEVESEVGAL